MAYIGLGFLIVAMLPWAAIVLAVGMANRYSEMSRDEFRAATGNGDDAYDRIQHFVLLLQQPLAPLYLWMAGVMLSAPPAWIGFMLTRGG